MVRRFLALCVLQEGVELSCEFRAGPGWVIKVFGVPPLSACTHSQGTEIYNQGVKFGASPDMGGGVGNVASLDDDGPGVVVKMVAGTVWLTGTVDRVAWANQDLQVS